MRRTLFITLLLLLPMLAAAECRQPGPECVAIGEWQVQLAVGAGMRTNPLADASDIPLVLIPQVSYYGQRFFIDTLDIGVTLTESSTFMLNAIVTPSTDGLYFFRSKLNRLVLDGGFGLTTNAPAPPQDYDYTAPENEGRGLDNVFSGEPSPQPGSEQVVPKMGKRRLAGMAGLEASVSLGITEWQLQLLQDVTGVHGGREAKLALSSGTQWGTQDLGLTIGINWKNGKLLDYYYGVSEAEAYSDRPAYTASNGTSAFARLQWNKTLTRDWRLLGSLQYEHLSSALRYSPLIEDDQVVQFFIGGVYHF